MSRPEMSEIKRGDELMMFSGTPGRRDGRSWSAVRVVTAGCKWIHVIAAERYTDPLPDNARWHVRKFLRADLREGEQSGRVGYTAFLATPEQAAYGTRLEAAHAVIRGAGLSIDRQGPFHGDDDAVFALAIAVSEVIAKRWPNFPDRGESA